MYYIEKRDGRKVQYNRRKIERAMEKAFIDVDGDIDEYASSKIASITDYIESKVKDGEDLTVEQIQDLVVNGLMNTKRKDVATSYVIFREDRSRIRQGKSDLVTEAGKKLMGTNIENQNANVDELSFGGRMGEARDILTKEYALQYIVSPKVRYNHIHNRIYTHDFSSYAAGMHNCLSIPYDDALANGFNTRQTDVRAANSVNTAFQLLAVIFQLQSLQQFGGCSATHLDWTMVPYIRKSFFKHYVTAYIKNSKEFAALDIVSMIFDIYEEIIVDPNTGINYTIERNKFEDWVESNKEDFLNRVNLVYEDFSLDNKDKLDPTLYQSALYDTIIELKQAVEGMFHNLNTLQSRSGNQLPFTSINFGTCTLPEGRLVIRALLEGSIKGVGKLKKTPIFPCSIFQCMKGVNRKPGDPNYDLFKLAIKSNKKRLYPNYANVDWSGNAGYDINDPKTYFSTMGCRTANGFDINGFGQMKDGRGNIAPATIIMPTLAMEAIEATNSEIGDGKAVEKFIEILDEAISDCRDGLLERFQYICSQPMESARFMYENNMMAGYDPEDKAGIITALKHGTLAIGQLGLAETLQILIGTNQISDNGMELAKRIEGLFKERCSEFKNTYYDIHVNEDIVVNTRLNFGVYYTPAENLCYTAMTKFKKKYGNIDNISSNDFFTNSMHVPVWEEVSPFEKIDIESQLTGYSSAGCITYIELDSTAMYNEDAIESYINYAMDHDIPYFAINIPNDICLDCGYTGEFNDCCPVCGSTNIQQLRRVTGYLTGNYKTAFNKGKQQEVELRYQHTKKFKKISVK